MSCKQLSEEDVRRLCDRVGLGVLYTSIGNYPLIEYSQLGQRGFAGRVECAASGTCFLCHATARFLARQGFADLIPIRRNAQLLSAVIYTASSTI